MGEGISPILAKLAERIWWGEYVDMGELLLPEFWSGQKDEAAREAGPRSTHKVADIFTWLQSFASYVCDGMGISSTGADGLPGHHCPGFS